GVRDRRRKDTDRIPPSAALAPVLRRGADLPRSRGVGGACAACGRVVSSGYGHGSGGVGRSVVREEDGGRNRRSACRSEGPAAGTDVPRPCAPPPRAFRGGGCG